jgi:hypothetical protein
MHILLYHYIICLSITTIIFIYSNATFFLFIYLCLQAGIPLPKTSVDQHKEMGNLVTPLIEAYRTRYDRLRSLLTGNLRPLCLQLIYIYIYIYILKK